MTVHFVNDTLLPTFGQVLSGSQSHHTMTLCSFCLRGKFYTLTVKDNCFCVDASFFAFDSSIGLVNSITSIVIVLMIVGHPLILITEQALRISAELGLDGFKASNRWLQSFKERHILTAQRSSGGWANVDVDSVQDWLEKNKDV